MRNAECGVRNITASVGPTSLPHVQDPPLQFRIPHSAFRTCPSRLTRSEEHTSELQSPVHLVCRLLLEKKTRQTRSPSSTAFSTLPSAAAVCCCLLSTDLSALRAVADGKVCSRRLFTVAPTLSARSSSA